jgi:hypothetical protein
MVPDDFGTVDYTGDIYPKTSTRTSIPSHHSAMASAMAKTSVRTDGGRISWELSLKSLDDGDNIPDSGLSKSLAAFTAYPRYAVSERKARNGQCH